MSLDIMHNIAKTKRYEKCSCEKESKFYYLNNKNTWRVYLFGQKIKNSLSPKIHMGFAKASNLKLKNEIKECDSRDEFDAKKNQLLFTKDFLGANITHPFKELIPFESSFHMSPSVRFLGACNTIYRRDKYRLGLENTDIYGIHKTLKDLKILPQSQIQCFLLGSGGAAKAFAFVIMTCFPKIKLTLLTRNILHAEKNFSMFSKHLNISYRDVNETLRPSSSMPNLLVNATPLGLNSPYKKAEDILSQLSGEIGDCFFDMIYFDTYSIQRARKLKINHRNGYTMLLEQAKYSFYLWTNTFPK